MRWLSEDGLVPFLGKSSWQMFIAVALWVSLERFRRLGLLCSVCWGAKCSFVTLALGAKGRDRGQPGVDRTGLLTAAQMPAGKSWPLTLKHQMELKSLPGFADVLTPSQRPTETRSGCCAPWRLLLQCCLSAEFFLSGDFWKCFLGAQFR